ncbi:hypothetical protein CRE_17187 [Caenorhabditis remanei]|uniref:Uncharacterized protein n=1 Tax=Caenorhabditis remanei TaxID=31234 RepID=E3M9Y4_CAERE|nr:hypothetical protein CRE_17187 [Caenorhabditis remanei]
MPPGGSTVGPFTPDVFYEYEPHALSQEEIDNRRIQQNTFRLFQETLEQVRALAEQIQEGIEQTARIQEEHRRIQKAMRRQKRLNRKRARQMEEQDEQRRLVIKMFFSCRERRQAFPDLARQYFQSIS